MHRVSAFLPSWDRRKSTSSSKHSLDNLFSWSEKPASPTTTALARLSVPAARVGRETFWPATLDRECDRAARILKSFCSDGYLAPLDQDPSVTSAEPRTPARVAKKIPPRIIQNAAGIAIFTCMRSGLWMTGSGGSGILIARKADGTWSPPSGILLHTPTLSFVMGVDIYDCVLVINNLAALEALTTPKVTLGEDISLTSGPAVPLDSTEIDIRWKDMGNTVLTYMKARGQAQDVNLNGCILAERANENERFYSGNVTVMDVLAGNVARHVEETLPLFEVIKAAEGRTDADPTVLKQLSMHSAPGDAMIETPTESPASPRPAFGIPSTDDPDPFGVLALEMAGLEIREAGTRLRPTSNQFDFNPSPTSPIFPKFSRQSVDTYASRSNRGSYMSTRTERTKMSDAYTQTSVANTSETAPSPSQSECGQGRASFENMPVLKEPEEIDYTKIDFTPLRKISGSHSLDETAMTESGASTDDHPRTDTSTFDDSATKASSIYTKEEDPEELPEEDDGDADDEDDIDDDEEEPVIFEIAAAVQPARRAVMASPIQVKGALVTIPKRIPPPLPARSPARNSRASKSEIGDVSHLHSPLRSSFSASARQSYDAASVRSEEIEIPSISEPVMGDVIEEKSTTMDVESAAIQEQQLPLSQDQTPSTKEVGLTVEQSSQLSAFTPELQSALPYSTSVETVTEHPAGVHAIDNRSQEQLAISAPVSTLAIAVV